jgi:5'-nucleotidase / UDP-sugar diphosphatase
VFSLNLFLLNPGYRTGQPGYNKKVSVRSISDTDSACSWVMLFSKHNRTHIMKKSARLTALLIFLSVILPLSAFSQQASLTIFHTNDTHGHLLPFSYPAKAAGSEFSKLSQLKNIGGIARRSTIVNRLRKELSQNGSAVWLVDAGDFTEGTPFSLEHQGEADVAAMNAASYDFSTLGNHEFNTSLSRLRSLLALFKYPVLCANAVESSGGLLTQESAIKELGSLKIGIFGLVTRESMSYQAAKEGVTISNEIDAARRLASALRAKADIVILLSHCGEKLDEKIAAAVPEIDVIVGGHSHSRLPSGEFVWKSDQLKAREINGTIIVQAHQWGGEIGRLDLLFEKDESGAWHVDRYRARLIPVTSDIPEDPVVAAIVARYWDPIKGRYDEVIGQAAGDFVARGDDLAQYNLVADAVRETFKTQIDFENMGGVRAELAEGKIRFSDLVDMDPFSNTVVTFRITGSALKEFLLKTRPAVSGIEYRIENGKLVKASVQGKPILNAQAYKGSANSFLAANSLKGIKTNDTGKRRLDVLIDYIRKKGTVTPVYDGRRVIIQ